MLYSHVLQIENLPSCAHNTESLAGVWKEEWKYYGNIFIFDWVNIPNWESWDGVKIWISSISARHFIPILHNSLKQQMQSEIWWQKGPWNNPSMAMAKHFYNQLCPVMFPQVIPFPGYFHSSLAIKTSWAKRKRKFKTNMEMLIYCLNYFLAFYQLIWNNPWRRI